ncbi:MAG TPA: YARHG domain-containing protein [Devosia sp.]|nr:YARHG domain-containing protein [Devosia sp.]
MKLIALAVFTAGSLVALPGAAMAASCYDLWYARNAIYDGEGYCFSSELGMETFDNDDCWTTHPHLTKSEKKQVALIKAEEEAKHCHVN